MFCLAGYKEHCRRCRSPRIVCLCTVAFLWSWNLKSKRFGKLVVFRNNIVKYQISYPVPGSRSVRGDRRKTRAGVGLSGSATSGIRAKNGEGSTFSLPDPTLRPPAFLIIHTEREPGMEQVTGPHVDVISYCRTSA